MVEVFKKSKEPFVRFNRFTNLLFGNFSLKPCFYSVIVCGELSAPNHGSMECSSGADYNSRCTFQCEVSFMDDWIPYQDFEGIFLKVSSSLIHISCCY